MKFERLKEKDAIYRAIQSFSTEFSSLKSRVDLNQYSQKLAEHSYTVLLKDENIDWNSFAVSKVWLRKYPATTLYRKGCRGWNEKNST